MLFLRSALLNFLCCAYCFTLAAVCYPFVYFVPGMARWVLMTCSGMIVSLLKWIIGLDYRVIDRKNIENRPALYVAQHQSMWETIVLFREVPNSVFIVKKSLLNLPLVGIYMKKYGLIGIDRSNKSILKRLTKHVEKTITNGQSVVIFPEGRRVAFGEVGHINPSFLFLAQEIGCPVIPITHNSGKFWQRKSFYKYPGLIKLQIHSALDLKESREQLIEKLKTLFSRTTQDA